MISRVEKESLTVFTSRVVSAGGASEVRVRLLLLLEGARARPSEIVWQGSFAVIRATAHCLSVQIGLANWSSVRPKADTSSSLVRNVSCQVNEDVSEIHTAATGRIV
jgi:hypothetical protein